MKEKVTLYASGLTNQGEVMVSLISTEKPDNIDKDSYGYLRFSVRPEIAEHLLRCQEYYNQLVDKAFGIEIETAVGLFSPL